MLLFFDETGINDSCVKKKMWCPTNKKKYKYKFKLIKNISIAVCMSLKEIEGIKFRKGSFNYYCYEFFIVMYLNC